MSSASWKSDVNKCLGMCWEVFRLPAAWRSRAKMGSESQCGSHAWGVRGHANQHEDAIREGRLEVSNCRGRCQSQTAGAHIDSGVVLPCPARLRAAMFLPWVALRSRAASCGAPRWRSQDTAAPGPSCAPAASTTSAKAKRVVLAPKMSVEGCAARGSSGPRSQVRELCRRASSWLTRQSRRPRWQQGMHRATWRRW